MHRHTRHVRLVGEKRLELCEAPGVECSALRPSSPDPRANVGQILDRNRPLCAFGLRYNPFGDHVVDVFGESCFLTSQDTQAAAAPQRAEPLQLVSEPPMAIAHVLDCRARMDRPIAIDGDVGHAQIDTQHVVNVDRVRRLDLSRGEQIPVPPHEGQITFAASECEQRLLTLPAHKRDGLPTIKRPDRHRGAFVGQDAFVKRDCTERSKRALGLLVQLVGIRHFGDTPHGELRGKAERLPHSVVRQAVDGKLAKRLCLPRHLADVVTRRVRRLKRAPKRIRLFNRRKELQLYRQLHIMSIPQPERMGKRRLSRQGVMRRYSFPLLGLKPRSFQLARFR